MPRPKLLVFTSIAAALTLSGCASKPTQSAPKLTSGTEFTSLQKIFIEGNKGAQATQKGSGLIALGARTPEESVNAPDVAIADFEQWCDLKSGTMYISTGAAPDFVAQARGQASALLRQASFDTDSHLERYCAVGSSVYGVAGYHVVGGIVDQRMGRPFVGHRFAWLSADEISTKGAASVQAAKSNSEAQARARDEREKADQALIARKIEKLQRSAKGTQTVCTGRQFGGASIADIWYECRGFEGPMSFAEFAKYGWRLGSQTMVPVLRTSGNYEQDVTAVFEKSK
jgi:hypothetical protein